jgi:hypothetical protein
MDQANSNLLRGNVDSLFELQRKHNVQETLLVSLQSSGVELLVLNVMVEIGAFVLSLHHVKV